MKNKLRKALLERSLILGGWMQIGHPGVAEILARVGFEWVCVDMEHGAIDLESMTNIFRTLDAFDCVPVARLPINDHVWIKRTLDAGARGLIIPMVNNKEQAEAALQNAKYPPRGARGIGYSRASMQGIDFDEYFRTANEETAIILQIEHKDAVANIESILEVPDVDGLFIGPLDLSGSYGKTGQMESPEVAAALREYIDACRRHCVAAGLHVVVPTPQNVHNAISQGYTLLALGVDNAFLAAGATDALKAARSFQKAVA